MFQMFLLFSLLCLSPISAVPQFHPQVLFRDSSLVHQASHSHLSPLGSVSHPSHFSSAVHRHNTPEATQDGRIATLQAPAIVQHQDGRFFAVNANLQQGPYILIGSISNSCVASCFSSGRFYTYHGNLSYFTCC